MKILKIVKTKNIFRNFGNITGSSHLDISIVLRLSSTVYQQLTLGINKETEASNTSIYLKFVLGSQGKIVAYDSELRFSFNLRLNYSEKESDPLNAIRKKRSKFEK